VVARVASDDADLPVAGERTCRIETAAPRRAADTLAADESGTGDAVRSAVVATAADDVGRFVSGADAGIDTGCAVSDDAHADGDADAARAPDARDHAGGGR
jgi:hypothetical protein